MSSSRPQKGKGRAGTTNCCTTGNLCLPACGPAIPVPALFPVLSPQPLLIHGLFSSLGWLIPQPFLYPHRPPCDHGPCPHSACHDRAAIEPVGGGCQGLIKSPALGCQGRSAVSLQIYSNAVGQMATQAYEENGQDAQRTLAPVSMGTASRLGLRSHRSPSSPHPTPPPLGVLLAVRAGAERGGAQHGGRRQINGVSKHCGAIQAFNILT